MISRLAAFILIFSSLSLFAAEDSSKVVLDGYEKIRAALAADNLSDAKTAATDLTKKATEVKMETVAKASADISKANNIEKARSSFKTLTQEAIKLAKDKSGYFLMTCPMANADWVQTSEKVENPYMGKQMLSCGMTKPFPK